MVVSLAHCGICGHFVRDEMVGWLFGLGWVGLGWSNRVRDFNRRRWAHEYRLQKHRYNIVTSKINLKANKICKLNLTLVSELIRQSPPR